MGTSSTKKLLRKIDNTLPGLSKILDPKNFDLSWEEDAAIEIASSLILASEKKKKLEKTDKKNRKKTTVFQAYKTGGIDKPEISMFRLQEYA